MVEEDTREFYAKSSQRFIQDNTTSTYVLFASEKLSKESERISYLWESDTESIRLIMRICENELIENHKDKLQEEFENMLQFENISDLNEQKKVFIKLKFARNSSRILSGTYKLKFF